MNASAHKLAHLPGAFINLEREVFRCESRKGRLRALAVRFLNSRRGEAAYRCERFQHALTDRVLILIQAAEMIWGDQISQSLLRDGETVEQGAAARASLSMIYS